MQKQCVVLKDLNDKPILVLELKTFINAKQFLDFKQECESNYKNFLDELKAKNQRIDELEKRIKKNELELAYNRGDLTEEEYENELNKLG